MLKHDRKGWSSCCTRKYGKYGYSMNWSRECESWWAQCEWENPNRIRTELGLNQGVISTVGVSIIAVLETHPSEKPCKIFSSLSLQRLTFKT